MNSLDELLKDTFDEDAAAVPHDDLLAGRVAHQARRQTRRARIRIGAVAAAAAIAVGYAATQLIPTAAPTFTPANSSPPPDPLVEVKHVARTTSYDQYLDELARWAGLTNPPEPERVQIYQDIPEQTKAIESCLAQAGYPGNVHNFANEAEHAEYAKALYSCYAAHRADDRWYAPRTESQIRFIRDFWTSVTHPCVHRMGFEIPRPPSGQELVDTWNDIDNYSPVRELAALNLPPYMFEDAIESCPMMPTLDEIMDN